ncbi:hypothetical protein B0H14DRAFT_3433359 [Mycena olivaceomarginata]|nr:hypothetical protein B0H14DRAFT_3433359 [Mycena olivaceomarginata]
MPHCAAVAPGSPALGALLPYRVPTPGSPGPAHCFPASQLSIQLQLHPPARVCALCTARCRPTRVPVFAPSAPPAAGLPVRRCLRPLHRPPQVYPSAGVCNLSPLVSTRSRPLRHLLLAHPPYLFLQTYLPAVHHPGTSPYFSVPGCFPRLLTLPSQYILHPKKYILSITCLLLYIVLVYSGTGTVHPGCAILLTRMPLIYPY